MTRFQEPLSGRGQGWDSSFSQIHNMTARHLSVRLYDDLMGNQPEPLELTPSEALRELLDPIDAEDLVATFLQARRNYMVMPASHRPDTPAYEQVLISREDGHRAIIQVKTGNSAVDLGLLRKAAGDDARAFAYSTTGRYSGDPGNVEILDEEQLLGFVREQPQFLPRRVRRWFEYIAS